MLQMELDTGTQGGDGDVDDEEGDGDDAGDADDGGHDDDEE